MKKIHRPLIAAAAVGCALAPAAQAATKTVDYGVAKPPKGTPEAASFADFYPRTVKVNVGDTVAYRLNGFGVVLLGKGSIPAFVQADTATPVAGAKDPAGGDFWFNGQPSFQVDPFFLAPQGDGKVTGKGVDSSGLPMDDGPPKPYKVKFTKPGSYTVVDAIHPYIKGKVVVVPKGRKVPSAAADKAAAAKQIAKAVKEAKKLAAQTIPANTIRLGNDSKNVTFYKFFPGALTATAGQPITVEAGKASGDVHNLVIGPMEWLKNVSPFEVQPPRFGLNAVALYPSQPPTAPLTFDGTQNGGFLSSGAIDADKATPPPSSNKLTITKPGTYTYYCLFHAPDMTGTITVQ